MSIECYSCGEEFSRISTHWEMSSSCSHPTLSENQRQILIGVLMGDGSIDTTAINPRISCSNTSKQYLLYLDSKFPHIGLGVELENSAESCAKRDRKSGFNKEADSDNYSDIYRWRTRCHPRLQEFSDWYGDKGKEFPKNIELTPTILKHWFVCDGYYNESRLNNHISIGISNEINNEDKISSYFTELGYEEPSHIVSKRSDGSKNCSILFSSETTNELFKYMGEPLPGFEYKWKNEAGQ